jgi:hypothetical protein
MTSVEAEYFIPRQFAELSLNSIRDMNNIEFTPFGSSQFSTELRETQTSSFFQNLEYYQNLSENELQSRLIKLQPIFEKTKIAAVDVASQNIGETKDGVICAIRGTIVWIENYIYRYLRCGPFLFHLTSNSQERLKNPLQKSREIVEYSIDTLNSENLVNHAQTMIERGLQTYVSQSFENAVVLWDGSLTASTFNSSAEAMEKILSIARKNGNTILAISKKTQLRIMAEKIKKLLNHNYSCLLDVDDLVTGKFKTIRTLGRVFIAKFGPVDFNFRLDIDREVEKEKGINAVQKLIGNDIMTRNYPETLRLAHILSVFTLTEITGVQGYLSKKYNITIHKPENLRRILFGPFAKWSR